MKWIARFGILTFALAISQCLSLDTFGKDDWRVWRGPNANGKADARQVVPTKWTAQKNVIWKTSVPGRGHSSPIVVDDYIFLTTANERSQTQSVLCYHKKTGKLAWKKDANKGSLASQIHKKNTHASPTVASDGKNIYAAFINHGKLQITAYTLQGEKKWQKFAGAYQPQQYQFGYGASPIIYKDTLIVSSEFETGGFLAAFDLETGAEKWRTKRGPTNSFSSPIVASVAGKEQLLISGGNAITSYDPATGNLQWRVRGLWVVTCGTVVWDDGIVFASGGYPKSGTMAVRADGSKKILWTNRVKCYEQSMLAHDGYLYGVSDQGVAYCWRAKDGKEMWKQRLRGPVSASPILVGDNIYLSNEAGTTFVYKASSKKLIPVAKNQLGNEAFATPTICGNRIYIRAADSRNGSRREMLYCIGKK